MLATSIQARGTATTTSAKAETQGLKRIVVWLSRTDSRMRSSPVMPKCTSPLPSAAGISADDISFTSTPGCPSMVAR
jgi:hypothetical protein